MGDAEIVSSTLIYRDNLFALSSLSCLKKVSLQILSSLAIVSEHIRYG
jgi:hypothetical protein